MKSGVPVDYQQLFNIAMTLIVFLAGWVLKGITDAVKRLDDDVRAIPLQYVAKEDYRHDLRDIKDLLSRIDGKLDSKADKE